MFDYAVADGATNMARDEAMMSHVAPGVVALRFYGWEPWCLSLGRNQPVPDHVLGRPRSDLVMGLDAVRRPTGGRSVFHGPELTYAFACSDRTAGGPRSVYLKLHRALASGLASLGAVLDAADRGDSSNPRRLAPDLTSCFRDPAPGELTVGGRKLVGSAQWRHDHVLLQHGSVLLSNEQGAADLAGAGTDESGARADAIGLADVLDPPPPLPALARVLIESIAQEFGAEPGIKTVPTKRLGLANEAKYRSERWGWRRPVSTQRLPCLG